MKLSKIIKEIFKPTKRKIMLFFAFFIVYFIVTLIHFIFYNRLNCMSTSIILYLFSILFSNTGITNPSIGLLILLLFSVLISYTITCFLITLYEMMINKLEWRGVIKFFIIIIALLLIFPILNICGGASSPKYFEGKWFKNFCLQKLKNSCEFNGTLPKIWNLSIKIMEGRTVKTTSCANITEYYSCPAKWLKNFTYTENETTQNQNKMKGTERCINTTKTLI